MARHGSIIQNTVIENTFQRNHGTGCFQTTLHQMWYIKCLKWTKTLFDVSTYRGFGRNQSKRLKILSVYFRQLQYTTVDAKLGIHNTIEYCKQKAQFLFRSDMEEVKGKNENEEDVSRPNDQKSETSNMSPREHDDETGTV